MEHGKNVSFRDIELIDGFWAKKQKLINETSIFAVWDRFKETGRFDAFKCDWQEGMPNRPHIFWDSDIAKWIESVAYILQNSKLQNSKLQNNKDDKLEAAVEELIDLIEKNQDSNGYFNIYFTVCEPKARFTRRYDHELYCAGHLIEAAVAYYETTGKDRFLKLMCKYADYIEKVFILDKTAAFFTPGHEEIELALVKLYHVTGDKRYLNMSKHFLDLRGTNKAVEYNNNTQDDVPVRQISEAVGHSVRAVYLYSAMADVADEFNDNELFDACRRVFQNIAYKRMYITGGIGSSPRGEAFSVDYDLPNMTAYSETCAALGLVLFARRMSRLDPDSIYADVAEKAIYNGFISSISLDGVSFFYENPLEIDPSLHKRPEVINGSMRFPPMRRQKVFGCSCCPPNIT
ncbi:MAG: glycoside hydrolase family protein, partial [Clostridia bacterium]|nr:glycoside hydrolase family protein [Clostridia bacterium]